MKTKKAMGAYYTPDYLADFIYTRLEIYFKSLKKLSILEPSVGDGSFLDAFARSSIFLNKIIVIKAIDINKTEITKLKKRNWGKMDITFIHESFLKHESNSGEFYNLIIGNPPYIKKNLLSANQIIYGNKIYKQSQLSVKVFKNIWSAFLLKSVSMLDNNGVLAFVLPAELLQVKYANELKEFILKVFERTEIYTFSDLMFECKGQNTIVLIGYKKHSERGVYYTHIPDINNKDNHTISLIENQTIQSLNIKWIHHTLACEDLQFLDNIRTSINHVEHFCFSKPGIVTAANNFFIIDSDTEKEYKWSEYTKPILQKGAYVQTRIVFNHSDYKKLSTNGKPMKIICLKEKDINKLNSKNKYYLDIGEKNNIPDRYKCRIRNHWSVIPNISEPPEGFFFKRSHLFPKIVKNEAKVLVTDSAYKIEMQDGYDINSFIFSFYNSLTLVFSELGGRYYGGGVLELTPNEFKKLPIPYFRISESKFKDLSKRFEESKDIQDILDYNDFILLPKIGLNREQILNIQSLRKTLSLKRRGMSHCSYN